MRVLCFLFLLVFAGAVALFAYQNQQEVTLRLLLGTAENPLVNWQETKSVALVVGAAYLLGMISGWTVVGMLRRSFTRASELIDNRQTAPVVR